MTDTTERIVHELTYLNYRINRKRAPSLPPESWVKVYGPEALEMEKRYQNEPKH